MNIFSEKKEWINKNVDIFHGSFPYLILTATSLFVYIKTISPTIYWRDSPEFANVGYTLGIAHPSGSPSYSLIAKLITFIPVGSIAFKINLVSLFFAILSILILFKTILSLINLCSEKKDEKLSNISALLTALIVIFSQSFWMVAVVAEVYTMNTFWLCLIIYFSFQWIKTGESKFLYLAVFFYGLSTGVHGGMLIFFPCFLLFFLTVEWKSYLKDSKRLIKKTLILSFFFLLGFSVFLFLPVRSSTNPPLDAGNPETYQRFINHLIDKKDSASFFSSTGEVFSLIKNAGQFSQSFINELTLIGFLCGIIGLIFHARIHKSTFLLCFLLFSANIVFYLTAKHDPFSNNIISLPSIIVFSFWTGLGIYKIVEILLKFSYENYFKFAFFITISGFILFSFLKDYNDIDKSTFYLAEETPKKMYLSMNPNSIVFSTINWVPYRYFQDIENLNQDIAILLISDLKNPAIFNPISAERFPNINMPYFESNKTNFEKYTTALMKLNFNSKYIYTGFNIPLNNLEGIEILPYKRFLAEVSLHISENKKNIIDSYLNTLKGILKEEISGKDYIFDQDIGSRTHYATYLTYISDYLIMQNRYKDAVFFLKTAANINRFATKDIMEMLGVCYVNQNNFKEADDIFGKLIDIHPDNYWYFYFMGLANFKMGKLEKAKFYLEKSILLNKNYYKSLSVLKQLNAQISKTKK